MPESPEIVLEVQYLTMRYGSRLIQANLNFTVKKGSVLVIMGSSGCGKSTLLRHLIGLQQPYSGKILYSGQDFWQCDEESRKTLLKKFGILYQKGGLWSSMTLAENIALPLKEYTTLTKQEIDELCELKLSLVGLGGFGNYYPSEISGGMQKRAGLARAMALDPEILFFDEPSAGLDPISSRRLDDLIQELSASLGSTIVIVTHELASIMAIATDSIFLDAVEKTITAVGNPRELLHNSTNPRVREFLSRGEEKA